MENIQLLYLNQSLKFIFFCFENILLFEFKDENWIDIRLKEESPSHLIKPITITFDLFKSKIIDNPQIPMYYIRFFSKYFHLFIYSSWKGNGQILSIQSHLSNSRLCGFIQLINTIPFIQSNQQDEQNV